jgi:hypothetical protein
MKAVADDWTYRSLALFSWFLKTVLWAYSGTREFMNDERFHLFKSEAVAFGSVTENRRGARGFAKVQ